MSKALTHIFFSGLSTLSPEEDATAREEFNKIKDCLERKTKVTYDNIMIAGSLRRMREKHGRNSNIYINFIESLAAVDESWSDKDYRLKWVEAYRGYESIAGSDEDKAFLFKLNPSASALKACQFLPGDKGYKIVKELRSVESFPSATAIERYGKYGSFTPKASLPAAAPLGRETISNPGIAPGPEPVAVVEVTPTIVVEDEMDSLQPSLDMETSNFPTPTLSSAAVLPPSTSNSSDIALQLKELYQQIEAIVLPNYRAIQEDPEARKYLQWITDLNRNYLRIES